MISERMVLSQFSAIQTSSHYIADMLYVCTSICVPSLVNITYTVVRTPSQPVCSVWILKTVVPIVTAGSGLYSFSRIGKKS